MTEKIKSAELLIAFVGKWLTAMRTDRSILKKCHN